MNTESTELYEQLISGDTDSIEPKSEAEAHLLNMTRNGVGQGEGSSGVTEPRSRIEAYLKAMIENGIPGGGSGSGAGGGSASIDVTAAVGQTIIVKEVDASGKPTKWESADYQPRTHGKEVVELLPNTTASFVEEAGGFMVECDFEFVSGNVYSINWNGVVYNCVGTALEGVCGVGNIAAVTGTGDTGEPFFAVVDGGMMICVPLDGSAELVIGVSGEVHETIDKNYLPSDILYGNAEYTRNPFDIQKWYYQETYTSDLFGITTDWVDTPITKKQFERLLEVFSTQPIYIRGFDGIGEWVYENGALIEPYEFDGVWRLRYMRFRFLTQAQIYLYNLSIRWSDENNCMQRRCELSEELIVSTIVV